MTGDNTYWAAVAQVIPVLVLAMGLEAREVTRRWTPNRRNDEWSVMFYPLAWIFGFAGLVYAMYVALVSLRGEPAPVPQGMPRHDLHFVVDLLILYDLVVLAAPPIVWALKRMRPTR